MRDKHETCTPLPMPTLKGLTDPLTKEEMENYFKETEDTLEENKVRSKRGVLRIISCAFLRNLDLDLERRRSHYGWCPYDDWMEFDPITEYNESIKAGAERIRQERKEKEG